MASQQIKSKNKFKEAGNTGVQIFNGIISGEEYNANLRGRQGLRTYDEMRKSDASVKMSLKAVKEPIKALPWFVQAATDDPKDVEVRDFVNKAIFDVLRFKTVMGEILTHLDFGFSVHEKVYDVRDVLGAERVILKKLAFRKQTSIARWEAGPNRPGVTQYGSGSKSIPIDLDRLVVFTNEQEGDNYEGVSILRAAYKHWYYKDKLYQIDAIGHERQALGVVDITYPKGADKQDIESAEEAARNIRANEEAFISHPEDFTVQFMDMKADTLKEMKPSIDHHDRQISKNVVAQFMDLGASSGSGSRAVGEPQLKIFEQAIQSVAEVIADTFNQYVVRDLVDLNFNVSEYPKLLPGSVNRDTLTELATSYKKLVEAGVLTPTEEDEDYLRGRLGLPDRPDDDADDEKDDEPKTNSKTPETALDEARDDTNVEAASSPEQDQASLLAKARSVMASIKDRLYGGKE